MPTKEKLQKTAEELGLEIEDICNNCGEDEIFNEELCVTCEEEK